MNQDSAHSEQDAPVADTAETNQVQKDDQASDHQESSTNKSDSKPPKNSKIKLIIGVIIIALLGLIIFGLWKSYQPKPIELQGRVEAETIHVSTKVPSRIEEIYVQEGQKISKGQPLVRLVSPEIEAKTTGFGYLTICFSISIYGRSWFSTREYRYTLCQLAKHESTSKSCKNHLPTW